MSLSIVTPPTEEPVSLETLKAHLRIDGMAEDAAVLRFAVAARAHIEQRAGLALMPQVLAFRLDRWPEETICLPRGPVTAVSEIAVIEAGDTWEVLSAESYKLLPGLPGRVTVTGEMPSPAVVAGGIRITFAAGYADQASVPAPLVQAVCLLTAHYHARREPVEERRTHRVPLLVGALIEPFRRVAI